MTTIRLTIPISVTLDSGANLKLMRRLQNKGFITITAVNVENGKENNVKDKIGPVGVWGHFKWEDGSVWGTEGNIYKQALSIVGAYNIQDARHLEAHNRSGNDIFVTEDKDDILNKASLISESLGITVMSPSELENYIQANMKKAINSQPYNPRTKSD